MPGAFGSVRKLKELGKLREWRWASVALVSEGTFRHSVGAWAVRCYVGFLFVAELGWAGLALGSGWVPENSGWPGSERI